MTTIVFGGGGFIGRRVVRNLAAECRDVVCADVRWPESLADVADCVECDVRADGAVADVMQHYEPSRVLNLASLLTTETADRPRFATAVNCQGMSNVLDAAGNAGVDRVVYASSIAAYGLPADHGDGTVTEETAVPAAFTRFPVTLYAATKQFNEYQAQFYADEYGMTVAGIRPGVVFGPGRESGLAGWASSFVSSPARGDRAHIPLRPDQAMSLVYRDDVAALFVALHDTRTVEHAAYNTGGHRVTVREVADLVDLEFDGSVSWDTDGDDLGLVADVSHERARDEFGYELTPLREAIRDHAAAVVDDY